MSSFPRFLSEGILGNIVGTSQSSQSPPTGISRSFELFIQTINKVSNKYEENQIVQRELHSIQQSISNPSISQVQLRDFLSRIIYCHMLGHDVYWSYIHAVKLAQQGTQIYKKIGYLTCCLLLHRDHELILLLINTIQKDLKSSNLLDNVAALSAASQLVPSEMIPSLLPLVLDKLRHPRVMVRQRAVMCLHQFYMLAPDLLAHNEADLRRMLVDKDPGVVAAYLHILQHEIQKSPEKHLTTGTVLVKILNQLTVARPDPMFDYHGVPFPWLRIHLIRCLSMLASVHQSLRTDVAKSLEATLSRLNLKENIGFALLYECLLCIVEIDAGPELLEVAAKHVERLLKSSDPNLKLIGVKALVRLVQADRRYATDYQDLIVQSLEHADTGVQRKMYKVLYQICHADNVEAVASKMLQQLATYTDPYWRSEVITMVTDIVSRFSDNAVWQVDTLYQCVQLGGRQVTPSVIEGILDNLQTGYLSAGVEVRRQQVLVQKSVSAMMTVDVMPALVLISTWVLGELCHLLKNISEDRLLGMMMPHLVNTELTYLYKSYILAAVQKLLSAQLISSGCLATSLRECLAVQQPPSIKHRLVLLLGVCQHQMQLQPVDPLQGGAGVDTTLSFLDDFVSEHLEQGASPYIPAHLRGLQPGCQGQESAYSESERQPGEEGEEENLSVEDRPRTLSTTSSVSTADHREAGLKLQGVKQVWSKQGRQETKPEPELASSSPSQDESLREEERRHRELSSALFAGLPSREKLFPEESTQESSGGFLSSGPDSGGWKKLHEASRTAGSMQALPQTGYELSGAGQQPYEITDGTSDILPNDLFENSTVVLGSTDVNRAVVGSTNRNPNGLGSRDSNTSLLDSKDAMSTLDSRDSNTTLLDSTDANSAVVGTTTALLASVESGNKTLETIGDSEKVYNSDDKQSAVMNDNSGFLNISVCSNDESRVNLSYVGEDFPAEVLGEVNILETAKHDKPVIDMDAGVSDIGLVNQAGAVGLVCAGGSTTEECGQTEGTRGERLDNDLNEQGETVIHRSKQTEDGDS